MLKDIIRIALRESLANPLRTGLALLGMVMGTTSLVGFDMLGRGTHGRIMSNMENLTNSRMVELKLTQQSKVIVSTRDYFNMEDEKYFRQRIPQIVESSLQSLAWLVAMSHGRNHIMGHLYGVEPAYNRVYNLKLKSGRFISLPDQDGMSLVCVLGSDISRKLYGKENPVGTIVTLRHHRFRVVGLLEPAPNPSINEGVFVPFTVSVSRFEESRAVSTIAFLADNISNVNLVAMRLEMIMKTSFTDRFPNFKVSSRKQALEGVLHSGNLLRVSLFGLAAVLMMVGGIGIMNVEMASVLERGREIGIRKAFGARDGDILLQLLFEAAFHGLISGLVGITLGMALGKILLWSVGLITGSALVAPVSIPMLFIAWLFATFLGTAFGLVPALRGARLDLIEVMQ